MWLRLSMIALRGISSRVTRGRQRRWKGAQSSAASVSKAIHSIRQLRRDLNIKPAFSWDDQEADTIYGDRSQAPQDSELRLRTGISRYRADGCYDQLSTHWFIMRQLHVQHYPSITSPRLFVLSLVATLTIIHAQISTFSIAYCKTRNQASLRHHCYSSSSSITSCAIRNGWMASTPSTMFRSFITKLLLSLMRWLLCGKPAVQISTLKYYAKKDDPPAYWTLIIP